MHDYYKQLLEIDFTHAKHCKDTPTAAVFVHPMFI